MSESLEVYETNTHVFVVKIWLEEKADGENQASWRGHITYLPGGERIYIDDLDEITAFIIPHLERMGVKSGWRARMKQLLKPGKGTRPKK
jgi:hypothetical protein